MGFLCSRRGHSEKAQASSALCFLVDGDCWRQDDIKERQPPPEQECSLIGTTEALKSLCGHLGWSLGENTTIEVIGVSGMEKSELWGWKVTSAGQFPGNLEVIDASRFGM